MKTFSKLILTASIALIAVVTVNAQLKIGHINSQELLQAMPETDSAQKSIEKKQVEYNQRMVEIEEEFNKKYEAYTEKMKDKENPLTVLQKQEREDELAKIQERAAKFEQLMQQDMQMLRVQLFQPIQEKAIGAVNEVAEENKFTYILDTGTGAVVYVSPESEDILPLVKTRLGLK